MSCAAWSRSAGPGSRHRADATIRGGDDKGGTGPKDPGKDNDKGGGGHDKGGKDH